MGFKLDVNPNAKLRTAAAARNPTHMMAMTVFPRPTLMMERAAMAKL